MRSVVANLISGHGPQIYSWKFQFTYCLHCWMPLCLNTINSIQGGHFQGCSRMGGGEGAKRPPSLISVTHILQLWNFAQLYLTYRRSEKYINHATQPMSSAEISSFHQKSANFVISRNADINCILIHNF